MGASVQQTLGPMEVKASHRPSDASAESVKNLHLHDAKAKFGAAVRAGIGARALKEFGHEGLVSAVCSGEKAPEYLARIYQDAGARRRFALALLENDPGIEIETVIKIRGAA